jgi:3-mercaptopyruvate sulfurtransferase SseA
MGLKPVAHIKGGFGAWKKLGGPVEEPERAPAKPGILERANRPWRSR